MKEFVPELNYTPSPDYMNIFGNVSEQVAIVKIFEKIQRQREILFEALSIKSRDMVYVRRHILFHFYPLEVPQLKYNNNDS